MSRVSTSVRFATVCLAVSSPFALHATLAALTADPVTVPFVGVSLKIGNETVPPGGIAQVKLFVTEPKPISTARARFSLSGFSGVEGIALMSPARDTLGVAVVRGSEVALSVLSPSATFGTDPDYPVVTIAGRVAATTPLGSTFALDLDAGSLEFVDASGVVYPSHFKAGLLRVAPNVGVDNVIPGSAAVAQGDVVTVVGRGFVPRTKVKLTEVPLSDVTYVDESHMQVTVARPTRMHGTGVLVVNPGGAQTKYFSYQRTVRQGTSLQSTLHDAVPVFPDSEVTAAVVDVEGNSTGLAIQNRQAVGVFATAELLDASGRRLAATIVEIRPGRFLLLELSELFGLAYSPSQIVRVRSLAPVQVMGVAVDAAGNATPLRAR